MTEPTTEPIPETHDADMLLEHIESKVSEFATWAKNALTHATEHTHAAPLGRLLGTLEQTSKEISNLKSTGVLFALQQPLEAWLEKVLDDAHQKVDGLLHVALQALDERIETHGGTVDERLSTLESRIASMLDSHVAQVRTLLTQSLWTPVPAPVPASVPSSPAPSVALATATTPSSVTTTETAPDVPPPAGLAHPVDRDAFPTLAEYTAEGFFPSAYEGAKAIWEQKHSPTSSTESSAENAPSDPATGASSESV